MSTLSQMMEMMTLGAVGPTQTVWSATNKSSDITLLSSATIAQSGSTGSGTGGIVVSVSSKTTGKFYAEMKNTAIGGTASAVGGGLDLVTTNLNLYLGSDANGFGAWADGAGGNSRHTYTNGVATNAATIGSNSLGTYIRIAVDVGAGKLWLSHFSSTSWLGGGDPATGTSPTYTFTAGTTAYLAACPRASGNQVQIVDPTVWASAAPSGFGVWT